MTWDSKIARVALNNSKTCGAVIQLGFSQTPTCCRVWGFTPGQDSSDLFLGVLKPAVHMKGVRSPHAQSVSTHPSSTPPTELRPQFYSPENNPHSSAGVGKRQWSGTLDGGTRCGDQAFPSVLLILTLSPLSQVSSGATFWDFGGLWDINQAQMA